MSELRLGIIGGSGMYAFDHLTHVTDTPVVTPWGKPADVPRTGRIEDLELVFISRHGAGHRYSPTEIPYAANICAMKMLGVTHLISISAVGSLQEKFSPGSFVIPDNSIDRTHSRNRTFFDRGIAAHVSMAYPFCGSLSTEMYDAVKACELLVNSGGTYLCIEGPQFSTLAESELYRSWGASIIGMTAHPEARLAREAELCYSCLAMVTDYDVWHQTEEHVSVEKVIENLNQMTHELPKIIRTLAKEFSGTCDHECQDALSSAIITDRNTLTRETVTRLHHIAGRYLPDQEI